MQRIAPTVDPKRKVRVLVMRPGRTLPFYDTRCANLGEAMAYATNAIAYDLVGEASWPSGIPLYVPTKLMGPVARSRVDRAALARELRRSPLVQDYLAEKMED